MFKRILVQDSTILKLPNHLFNLFSGVSNGLVQVANARIQFAFDLLSERLTYLSVDPYSCNDIKRARCLHVRRGDLVLRDRGYLSITEVVRILGQDADFIYRYKHKLIYLDVKTGLPIPLLRMLRDNPNLDILVRLQNVEGPIVRLVAGAVNEDLANRRRQKLKKESHTIPSKECLALLSWSIFITSIDKEQMNYDEVRQLYMLRWRVEILFKVMKTNLRLDQIHDVPVHQLYFIIYARIILLILITRFVYLPARLIIKRHFEKEISILKLANYLGQNPIAMIDIIEELLLYHKHPGSKIKILERYCCYDKKLKRNFPQFVQDVLLS